VPGIALIQDGTEVARQWIADVAAVFERCCRSLSEYGVEEFALSIFTDEDAVYLLDGLDRDEWACLVFASNALLSGQIEGTLERHRASVHRYVAGGGGVVVLHQWRDSLAPLLPAELLPPTVERDWSRTPTVLRADDEHDVLLHYPFPVDWRKLRDVEDAGPRGTPSLFFKALDRGKLPGAMKPVLSGDGDEVVISRAGDHVRARVVVATAPLDWHAARPGQEEPMAALLANAVRYAALGPPKRLVWRRAEGVSNQLLIRWLGIDGAAAALPAPPEERPLTETETWLLTAVDLFLLPSERLAWAEATPEVRRFLAQGGALVAAADTASGGTRVTAVVGRHEERALATRLYAELRAVEGWRKVDYAFELRNVVRALRFLWGTDDAEPNRSQPAAISPRDLADLAPVIRRERLALAKHREDLSSSIALAETLSYLLTDPTEGAGDVAWLADEGAKRGGDLALQIRAVLALPAQTALDGFLAAAVEAFAAADSLAAVVRILDAVAVLDEAGLLPEDAVNATRLAELACDFLDRTPATREHGWMSVEATGELTRGLVALHALLGSERPDVAARVIGHVATGATALRQAVRRYERNWKGIAWLACIVHAVIIADRAFPIGLQRLASLEWPDPTAADAVSARTERSLLQQLALENEKLRVAESDLRTELADEHRQHLAARIGRGAATLVPVALLGLAVWAVVDQVGWDTPAGLVALLAVALSLAATLLSAAFALLEYLDLLAGPAPRILGFFVERVAPNVEKAGKLKRG